MNHALNPHIEEALSPQQDVDLLLSTLESTEEKTYPYRHWILQPLFAEEVVDGLLEVPFELQHDLHYQLGTREEHNPTRSYANFDALQTFPVCKRVADIFLNRQVISKFEEMGKMSLQGSLLRMEYAMDTQEFWLTPHTDIGPKLLTMLIYLSEGKDSETWGTDIYENADTHAMAVPYKRNSALMFIPSSHTWHGFERRFIDGVRKSLIVNYVTQEWRNRHELVHPTQVVY
ncbi:MAG: 2OG-Fe(II) oxygenase [Alphaproteobacteria bacterium]